MGPTVVLVVRIVEGRHADAADRIGHAHARGDPVRAGVSAEVGVERAVLLHDDDHVPDLVDAFERRIRPGGDRERDGGHREYGAVHALPTTPAPKPMGALRITCLDAGAGCRRRCDLPTLRPVNIPAGGKLRRLEPQ